MANTPPYIEAFQGRPYSHGFYPGSDRSTSWLNKKRLIVFLSIFALCCLVSLPYNFIRPPVYESTGTLLFILPSRDIETDEEMDRQHVTVQRQVLISNPMLTKILNHLGEKDDLLNTSNTSSKKLSDLKSMLKVIPTENMNVVKLSARGQDQELLPLLVNTWIDVYLEDWADLEKSSFKSTNTGLRQQVDELERKVAEKRQKLDQFRKKYDIVSMEREENWTLAGFSGLTDALKKAKEEQTIADAHLKAIKDSIAQGKPFVRAQDQDVLTNLEDRAVQIQEQLREMERKYTPQYMEIDSQARALIGKRELLKEKIRIKSQESQRLALAEAEQAQVTAQQIVIDLQHQLNTHKKKVAEFSKHFAEHEALKEELGQLERLNNEASQQLVKMEVTNKQQLAQIQVLERAFFPEYPVWPHYLRDAGISVAGAFLLGLVAVWFYEFVTRPTGQPAGAQRQPLFYAISDQQKIQQPTIREVQTEQPMLEQRLPRELSESEVKALTDAADDSTRLLINTILSGLSIEETAALCWRHINLKAGSINVPGESARTVLLSVRLRDTFAHHARNGSVTDGPVWQDTKNNPLSISDLAELISRPAHDAKLNNPSEINHHAIRHTYLAFLVRQGAQTEELDRITGPLPPASLAVYSILSPPGPGLPLNEIETVYPTLRDSLQEQ